jgi:hypothetical protein
LVGSVVDGIAFIGVVVEPALPLDPLDPLELVDREPLLDADGEDDVRPRV